MSIALQMHYNRSWFCIVEIVSSVLNVRRVWNLESWQKSKN